MSLIRRVQRQRITYWELKGANQYGEHTYMPPVELAARVDPKIMQVTSQDGTINLSRYQLITEYALLVGGVVMLGEITAVSYWNDPLKNLDAYQILAVSTTPNIRQTESLYEAWA